MSVSDFRFCFSSFQLFPFFLLCLPSTNPPSLPPSLPQVNKSDFKFIVTLERSDHLTPQNLAAKLATIASKLSVRAVSLALLPWPSPPRAPEEDPYTRKERAGQLRVMKATWAALEAAAASGAVAHLGVHELTNDQISALSVPSPGEPPPSLLPRANWMEVSPWRSQMHRVRFCHSRGIQVLGSLQHDPSKIPGGSPGSQNSQLEAIRKAHGGRSARQILTLWAVERGLVVFPCMDDVKNGEQPKTAEAFEVWR